MSSNFSFPEMKPAAITEALHSYGLAPAANLRPEDIANPQPDLLPAVLSIFLASVVDPLRGDVDGDDTQLGFEALQLLDNPEHHAEAIRVLRLYHKARVFLESIQFHGFTLRDLLRPDKHRVAYVLSALINFLYYRDDKLNLLQPIVDEFPKSVERRMEIKAKIAEHQKAIADHELAAQMEEPMVQQLEAEVSDLKKKIQAYNKQQMALRGKGKAITEKKEEILREITKADFELMKHAQENSKLLSKIVQSPEKIQRALEEKKSARNELKNAEKKATQNVQEKTATLEIYSKAYEKLEKQFSKIQDLHEQVAAAKAVEKEVKAHKAKLRDESVSIMALDAKIVEWQGKVCEAEERLKAKLKERDQRITEENQKLSALRAETEWKLQCLGPREKEVEAMVAKASTICSEADSVRAAATAKQQQIHAKFEEILQAFNYYMGAVNPVLEQVEDISKETL